MHIAFFLRGYCESSQWLLGPNGDNTTPRNSLVQFGDLIHNIKAQGKADAISLVRLANVIAIVIFLI